MDYAEVKKINKMTFKLMKAARDAVANGTRTYSVDMTEFGINRTITRELAPEPFKPLSPSLYKEAVNKLLESNGKLGFVVMDGNRTLFGTLSNTHEVEVLFEFEREQQIGGLSALDLELGYGLLKSHEDYYKKTSELATQYYIDPTTEQPNIEGRAGFGWYIYL